MRHGVFRTAYAGFAGVTIPSAVPGAAAAPATVLALSAG